MIIYYKINHTKRYNNLTQVKTNFIAYKQIYGEDIKTWLIGKRLFYEGVNGLLETVEGEYNVSSIMRINKLSIKKRLVSKDIYYVNSDFTILYSSKEDLTRDENQIDPLMILSQNYFYVLIDDEGNNYYGYLNNDKNKLLHCQMEEATYDLQINNNTLKLKNVTSASTPNNYNSFDFNDLDNIYILKIGNGLIAELCYYETIATYNDYN